MVGCQSSCSLRLMLVPMAPRLSSSCGCRKLCHLMRPGHIRELGRRAGLAGGRGRRHLLRMDRFVLRTGVGSASGVAGECCCDTRSHVVSELVEEVG